VVRAYPLWRRREIGSIIRRLDPRIEVQKWGESDYPADTR
jgi:hypothetical protein